MTGELVGIIAGIVAVTTILARTIEQLVGKVMLTRNNKNGKNGKQSNGSCLSQAEHDALKSMSDLISKTDENGTPLIYVPRSLDTVLEDVDKSLTNITIHQEKMTFILERLINKLDQLK
jgi:hypothetical protein